MSKEELVKQILPLLRLPTHEQSRMRAELESHTVVELRAFLGVVSAPQYQTELAEDQILQIQAERAADQILFQLQRQKATEPQRKQAAAAQLAQDKQTFADAAKTLRSFGVNEANFRVIRQTLGEGFSLYAVQQMLAANAAILSPPTQQERDEAVEQYNDTLQRMEPEALRARVRQEAADSRVANAQAEADSQLAASKARDAVMGFPSLPETWQGQKLDAAFIKTCSAETQKFLQKRFGSGQLTARLRGVA